MACGTPVVMTNCKGNLDYAPDGHNCLMSEPDHSKQLAEHMVSVLQNDRIRDRLVEGGYETAEKFTWDNVVQKVESAFKEST
jgi:glycosyltransferase involved in cell wall biosynthesis